MHLDFACNKKRYSYIYVQQFCTLHYIGATISFLVTCSLAPYKTIDKIVKSPLNENSANCINTAHKSIDLANGKNHNPCFQKKILQIWSQSRTIYLIYKCVQNAYNLCTLPRQKWQQKHIKLAKCIQQGIYIYVCIQVYFISRCSRTFCHISLVR